MVLTPSEREREKSQHTHNQSVQCAGLAHKLCAFKVRGLPLGHWGHSQSQGGTSSALLAQRSIPGGKTHVCQRGEGPEKNCSLSAHMAWFNRVRHMAHGLQREEQELCVLLCVIEAFSGKADPHDVEGAQA